MLWCSDPDTTTGCGRAPGAPAGRSGAGYRARAMENLFGLSRAGLGELAGELGLPAYRGRQLFRHLYARGVTDLDAMTDLPASLRERLARRFEVRRPRVAARERSSDGTVKLLLELDDGLLVETVAIATRRTALRRRSGRAPRAGAETAPTDLTVCVSTQVGCPLACTFCASGAVRFRRNLTAGEIAAQVLLGGRERSCGAKSGPPGRTNVVYMGMGEPLLNTDAVLESLDLLTDPDGFAVPWRRITVSTVGLPAEIRRLGRTAPKVGIAVSLHAGGDRTRRRIMPIARRHPMAEIFAALTELPRSPRRRVTLEYVLLGGENDQPSDARALVRQLGRLAAAGVRARVNLIAFNPWTDPAPGAPHQPGSETDAERFLGAVSAAGYVATLRRSRGRDAGAACGQLAAAAPETA